MPKTELRSEVQINAPVPHVYRILSDFERYPEWNPFVTRVRGPLTVGQQLAVELSLPEGSSYDLAVQLTQVRENAEIRWRARYGAAWLLSLDHFFQLSELPGGKTRAVQGQDFSGFLLRFAARSLTLSARGCVYLNQALKKRAEQNQ